MRKKLLDKIKSTYIEIKRILKGNISVLLVVFLIQLMLIAYLFNHIVYTVESGQAAVLYKRFGNGTITDRVFSEGLHLICPWDKLYIYNIRVQQRGHTFSVLTKNGLKVKLFISIRYNPEYNLLGVLHKKVGPNYVNEIVLPEIESVLRLIVGQLGAEEIYTTKTGLIDKAINEAIEQISRRFVKVDDVIIKEVELPESVAGSIRYKIEQKHMAEAHLFKILKAKREAIKKRIEADGLKAYNELVNLSLNENVLQWMGIQATIELSKSENSKVVVIGSGKRGLPIIGNLLLEDATSSNTNIKVNSPKLEADKSISKQKNNQSFNSNPIKSLNKSELNELEKVYRQDQSNIIAKIDKNENSLFKFQHDSNQALPPEFEQILKNDSLDLLNKSDMTSEKSSKNIVTEKDQ